MLNNKLINVIVYNIERFLSFGLITTERINLRALFKAEFYELNNFFNSLIIIFKIRILDASELKFKLEIQKIVKNKTIFIISLHYFLLYTKDAK